MPNHTASKASRSSRSANQIDSRVWSVVTVVILGTIMATLDTTIVNVALEPVARNLHTSISSIQWVVTGYLLSIAVVIPVTGWTARRIGPKQTYLAALGVFTIGSALCGLATSPTQLIVFRVVQGIGGGAIVPVGQMILVKVAGPDRLPRVMSAYGVPTMLAPILGPTVGGVILTHASWRWIFYVNVPIGVLAIARGLSKLPAEPAQEAGRLDVRGLALAALGLVGLTYGLSQFGTSAPVLSHVTVPVVGGAILMVAFVALAFHVQRPLLDMRLYANTAFSGAAVATFFLGGVLTANSLLMPLYLQTVRHQDAFQAGLLVGPRGIGAAIGAWLSGRLMEAIGTGPTAAVGCSVILIFTAPFVLLDSHTTYAYLCIVQFLQGIGIGTAIMPAQTAGYRALRPEQVNDATPQQNILTRVGSSIGTAVLISILQTNMTRAARSLPAQVRAFDLTFAWLLAFSVVALLASAFLIFMERRQAKSATRLVDATVEAATQLAEAR